MIGSFVTRPRVCATMGASTAPATVSALSATVSVSSAFFLAFRSAAVLALVTFAFAFLAMSLFVMLFALTFY